MSLFRPCIDLHQGKVKQIVGNTFSNSTEKSVPEITKINFESQKPAQYYAKLYKKDNLQGGHLIQLGQNPKNLKACLSALKSYPQGLQIGGGINIENAPFYLNEGASHIIVTSYLFPQGKFSLERLQALSALVGKDKIVVDLSCKKVSNNRWMVASQGWINITTCEINPLLLQHIEPYCSEFLIHATHVEGLCQGVDLNLVKQLSSWVHLPTTYAGGVKSMHDLYQIQKLSNHTIDITVGSSLDLFGGTQVKYIDCLAFNRENQQSNI